MKHLFVFVCMHGCFALNIVNYEEQKTLSCFDLIWKILVFGWSLPSVPCC